jgi:hypothetical protein
MRSFGQAALRIPGDITMCHHITTRCHEGPVCPHRETSQARGEAESSRARRPALALGVPAYRHDVKVYRQYPARRHIVPTASCHGIGQPGNA